MIKEQKFQKAIVKRPCKTMINCLTTAKLRKPDYELALRQHDSYIDALKSCGLEVKVLEADDSFPDSCFVEDTVICTKKFVIITNPGASSRKGEIEAIKK